MLMDPHALSQGRAMLLVRGGLAFLIGVVISNQPEASADALMTLFGLWALLEGAATIRQAYARVDQSEKIAARPVLLVLGGVAVVSGLLAIFGLGLSSKALTWVLAAWVIVRMGFEVWCAIVAPLTRIRVLFALSALVDVALVAFLVTHTSGSVSDLALVGGAIVALWGVITLVIGMAASKVDLVTAAGPRLLQSH
jgi:uncharacterized membrane protein HdeD (DUF308 family)